jgi:hypothetical protein
MTTPADDLTELNAKFENLKGMRLDLRIIFDEISLKLQSLNKLYEDLVKTHGQNDYTFGIDSFYFQNKLINMEYENMLKLFSSVDNRVYCEYYKIYKLILDYVHVDLKHTKILDKVVAIQQNFPPYKDLEPLKNYDFALTCNIQQIVMQILHDLQDFLVIKQAITLQDKQQSEMGINIDNIVHAQVYNNVLLHERITMYMRYIESFNLHHHKYLSRLTLKSKIMIGIVNQDIQLKSLSKINTTPLPKQKNALNRKASCINLAEEKHLKELVNFEESDVQTQNILTTILEHIPTANL